MLRTLMKQRIWTSDQRLQQAQRIHQQKPREFSTGPKTSTSKAISRKNSLKHGARCQEIRELQYRLTEWKRELKELSSYVCSS